MSRRAIKRIEESLQQPPLAPDKDDSDGSFDDFAQGGEAKGTDSQKVMNMFDLLGVGDDDEEDDAEFTEVADEEIDKEAHADAETKTIPATASAEKPKGKKKRRKKKRKGQKNQDDEDWFVPVDPKSAAEAQDETESVGVDEILLDPTGIPDAFFASDDDENIRETARAVMAEITDVAFPDGDIPGLFEAHAKASSRLVAVDQRLLNSDTELKRLFGSQVVENQRRSGESSSASRRMQRYMRQNARTRPTVLVPSRDRWLPSAPGLTMVLEDEGERKGVPREENVRYFRFHHETQYAKVQSTYNMVVGTHDVNHLVQFVSAHPFHVEGLLQLAEVNRRTGEFERAGDFVERALYALECAWDRRFKPFDGECRLRFRVRENRPMFAALFWYVQYLTRKGLHRTALEGSKLLLNLDPPGDPLGVLLLIDSLALLSKEYQWVRSMHRGYHHVPLELFPNYAFSAALAGLLVCNEEPKPGIRSRKKEPSKPSADGVTEAEKAAREELKRALLAFPMALGPLLSAAKKESDIVQRYELYHGADSGADLGDRGALLRICRIYAERSSALWKAPENLTLLLDAATAAGASAAGGMGAEGLEAASEARELRHEAAQFFASTDLYREAQIADFAESQRSLPAEVLQQDDDGGVPQGLHGPATARAVGQAGPQGPMTAREAALAFFQSILPWSEAGDAGAAAAAEPQLGELGAGTWERLLEAMGAAVQDSANADPNADADADASDEAPGGRADQDRQ